MRAGFQETATRKSRGLSPIRLALVALAVLTVTALPALTIWGMLAYRAQILTDTEVRTRNLARVFAGHAARSLGEVTRVIEPLARRLSAPGFIRESNADAVLAVLNENAAPAP